MQARRHERLQASSAASSCGSNCRGDMGIDGFWWFAREQIQVKQHDHVGRETLDKFETAIRHAGCDSGYVLALSFTKGAVEEVARAKGEGLNIRLVRVKELLLMVRRTTTAREIGPQPEGDLLPLPPPRRAEDKPSAEELVAGTSRNGRWGKSAPSLG